MTDEEKLKKLERVVRDMHRLLWGAPGSSGPGKVMGRQHRLKMLSKEGMGILRGDGDEEKS